MNSKRYRLRALHRRGILTPIKTLDFRIFFDKLKTLFSKDFITERKKNKLKILTHKFSLKSHCNHPVWKAEVFSGIDTIYERDFWRYLTKNIMTIITVLVCQVVFRCLLYGRAIFIDGLPDLGRTLRGQKVHKLMVPERGIPKM